MLSMMIVLVAVVSFHGPVEQFKTVHKRGVASLYIPWVKSSTVPYARYAGAWRQLPKETDRVCAHRWLPFKTILRLTSSNGLTSTCVVLDRGPFGACVPAEASHKAPQCPEGFRYIVETRRNALPKGGYYRGVIDATPLVHKSLKSKGWIWVKVERRMEGRKRKSLHRSVQED